MEIAPYINNHQNRAKKVIKEAEDFSSAFPARTLPPVLCQTEVIAAG